VTRVRAMPTLLPSRLLAARPGPLPPGPLSSPQTSLWFSGRVALAAAIDALGLAPGDWVALPAFCCGSEVDPFVARGIGVRFFGLTPGLDPEPASFERAVAGARAALAVHYFGFAADLAAARRVCKHHGAVLIEDCAHALFARDGDAWVGAGADAAVFSIVKTLAVPDGGALRLAPGIGIAPPPTAPSPTHLVRARARQLVALGLQAHPNRLVSTLAFVPSRMKARFGVRHDRPDPASEAALGAAARFDPALAGVPMSALARALIARVDPDDIARRRRAHYREVADAIAHSKTLSPLFPSLPEGACPLAFPVRVTDPDAFRDELAALPPLGVRQMWPWFHPAIPWARFEREAAMKREVFILPVHQDLTPAERTTLVETLARLA